MGLVLTVAAILGVGRAEAQPLGTFRWQLRPFCNVVTVAVTQNGAIFRLEGTDDQCGNSADAASATGTAFLNPDGTIGFGLTIVTTPGGRPLHVDAEITVASLGGTWRDSTTESGTFVFTPGAGTGGSPRPLPSPSVPTTILLRTDGSLVAGGVRDPSAIPPASGAGERMMWYPGKAAFRVGSVDGTQWDDANVGVFSTAMGANTTASGNGSTAMGSGSTASGFISTAIGAGATASGGNSTAIGRFVTAAGPQSVAIGSFLTAAGAQSIVLGSNAETTTAAIGSFVFGDSSPHAQPIGFQSFQPNQFFVRAAGGARFYSNANLTAGVNLAPGDGSWTSLSDVHRKTDFRPFDGEAALRKLAAMPIHEWSYISQDPAIRHVGPTAQDFRAAFGLGADPLGITTIDADGVALAAVQALEVRSRQHAEEIALLKAEIARLTTLVASLSERPR